MEVSDLEIALDILCALFTHKAKSVTMIVMKVAHLHLLKSSFCGLERCSCLLILLILSLVKHGKFSRHTHKLSVFVSGGLMLNTFGNVKTLGHSSCHQLQKSCLVEGQGAGKGGFGQ